MKLVGVIKNTCLFQYGLLEQMIQSVIKLSSLQINTEFFNNFDLNQIFSSKIMIEGVTQHNLLSNIRQLYIAELFYNSLSFAVVVVYFVIGFIFSSSYHSTKTGKT